MLNFLLLNFTITNLAHLPSYFFVLRRTLRVEERNPSAKELLIRRFEESWQNIIEEIAILSRPVTFSSVGEQLCRRAKTTPF